ncbi:MAG TPA: adenylosuccinate lyase [Nitrospiria bacterium]
MISRYTLPEMGKIWDIQKRFETWLRIEILACEAISQLGLIPKEAVQTIKRKAVIDVDRILEVEAETKHDVIAFVTSVAESVGPEGRYIHYGLTSSDLLDTSMACLLREASERIIGGLNELLEVLKERAKEFKQTVMIGRSHGIHGEPITFGFKLAIWYEETQRNLERMEKAKEEISYGKISGSMGTFAHLPPFVEEYVCNQVGLKPAPISNQVVQRDRHAQFMTTLAIVASSLDKFSTEIRHLQRTEVREVEEFFSDTQKGSSSMPHKRNPIGSENISGLARLVRSYSLAALENIPLWHERDISHSSVERVILPDGTILVDFMIQRFINLLKTLVVFPERMAKNLDLTGGLIYSQRFLLELTQKGIEREQAYGLVQKYSRESMTTGKRFDQLVRKDPLIQKHFNQKEIDGCFAPDFYLKHIDTIYKRVFD